MERIKDALRKVEAIYTWLQEMEAIQVFSRIFLKVPPMAHYWFQFDEITGR